MIKIKIKIFVFDLWHARLGHPSGVVVKKILNDCYVNCMKISIKDVCGSRQKGKSHKLPYSASTMV